MKDYTLHLSKEDAEIIIEGLGDNIEEYEGLIATNDKAEVEENEFYKNRIKILTDISRRLVTDFERG